MKGMEDTLWKWTVRSNLGPQEQAGYGYDYVYSDVGFYLMKRIG